MIRRGPVGLQVALPPDLITEAPPPRWEQDDYGATVPIRRSIAADTNHLENLLTVLTEGAEDRRLHPSRRRDYRATRDAVTARQAQISVWTPAPIDGYDLESMHAAETRVATRMESAMMLNAAYTHVAGMPGWAPAEIARWEARAQRAHYFAATLCAAGTLAAQLAA